MRSVVRILSRLLLVMAAVGLWGPRGLPDLVAATSAVACPCEQDDPHAGQTAEAEPCDDAEHGDCGDGCPDCACCPGAPVAALDAAGPALAPAPAVSGRSFALVDAPPSGARTGVFRPPRA